MEAVIAKVIAVIILLVITLILGTIPYFIIKRGGDVNGSFWRERILSLLNCFAGGVFLGTCLLHLFVEGKEDLETALEDPSFTNRSITYPVFEVLVGTGFFLIALLEQFALMCMAGVAVTSFPKEKMHYVCKDGNGHAGERTPLMHNKNDSYENGRIRNTIPYGVVEGDDDDEPDSRCRSQSRASELERSISHTHEFETISNASAMRACLLLIALSFHTIFDGLAVGLQVAAKDVWEIFAAISIHKSLVAFCLGLQLFRAFQPWFKKPFGCLLVFSLMSPIGISIGIAVTSSHLNTDAQYLASGVLQGIACGTFLYVTCFEILRDELTHKSNVLKVVVAAIGFGAMAGVKALDRD